ncbi:hypothetical protein JOQ06_018223 [Pogonophryne albipinna]|uniref:SET domain-containing protein n=1 Tax=Pogonophryne albipinna TaxID=1090488 RepID=A0AAD6AIN3_9TELE|nr:hypothetical protein JOQ06_018223 [Pogonophryne albipinna]
MREERSHSIEEVQEEKKEVQQQKGMQEVQLRIGPHAILQLPGKAVVEFQVHDWLQRTTITDGTTIRLTSSKAAGNTFTLSQQEDELLECYFHHVRAEAIKGLTSGQGSLPTPPVSVGKQWDTFLEVFPVSLHSAPPSKRLCVGAGFTAHRPLYQKWRSVQLLERTSYILSQAMGRQAIKPTEEAVRRALTKEGWVNNTPSIQGVVGGWVAPQDAPTSNESLIRSISEQSWRGLAVESPHGQRGCRVRLPRHPRVRRCPDGPREVLVFLALQNIKVGEELLSDYGVTRASFGGEGRDLAWLDM